MTQRRVDPSPDLAPLWAELEAYFCAPPPSSSAETLARWERGNALKARLERLLASQTPQSTTAGRG